jgi:UDP-N-acetylmuramoyl-L-alanyl-D-glutamate--2,6-diaminopimelate ligase
MKVIGITGTNGKTTTTFLLRHLLGKAGIKCGLIGTCVIDDGRQNQPAAMTTPGAVTLAEVLAAMRENGCQAVAMETSSHALVQGRVAGVRYAGAGFTNLTGDHADYHRTMDDYAAAKAQLFMHLDDSAVAAVNCGDSWSERLLRHCRARAVRFSSDAGCCGGQRADYSAGDATITSEGSMFILHTPTGHAQVSMRLVGRHNIQNAMCAASIAGEVFGMSTQDIARGLADAWGAPGRMQRVDAGQPFGVLVDYAHTDDALANVLSALRPITTGKLRVVFGCGGDRDPTKRPRMAAVAEKWADAVYVTSDNPRTEEPEKILEQIVAGFERKRPALVEPDRRLAIRRAIAEAQARDVVLIAGKGHENYQILGSTKHPFDDAEEARQALESLGS